MARAGRKRKAGARRHPNGTVVRERAKPTKETVQRRAVQMAEVLVANPSSAGGPMAQIIASHPDTGWFIGRLFLAGVINQDWRDAGDRYRKARDEYFHVIGGPRSPRAIDARNDSGPASVNLDGLDHKDRRKVRNYLKYRSAMSRVSVYTMPIAPEKPTKEASDKEKQSYKLLRRKYLERVEKIRALNDKNIGSVSEAVDLALDGEETSMQYLLLGLKALAAV